MDIKEALKLTGAERRRALRVLTRPHFDEMRKTCISVLKASPIVGKGDKQLDVRPMPSALRDALDWQTLLYVAEYPDRIGQVFNAIQNPMTYGVSDSGTKTGFLFGRPSGVDDTTIENIIAKHTKGAAPMTTTTSAMDLSALIDILDIVDESTDAEFDNIVLAMKRELPHEASRIDAMVKAALARGSRPSSAARGPVDMKLVERIKFGLSSKSTSTTTLDKVGPEHEGIINAVLNVAKLPPINDLIDKLNKATADLVKAKAEPAVAVPSVVLMPVGTVIEAKASGEIPNGKIISKRAFEVFAMPEGSGFDFEVPVWEWDGAHPDVKPVDPNYIFRQEELLSLLYSIITNERCWLHGHTGTGKTTLIEQVAARLNWPVRVVNFDSEITRMDLIGRDTLINEGGVTTSKFIDGILPQCMADPYFIICDEMDYIRPDVSYVMQRVFEGNGLTITEDGGRHVKPHPMFRIFATGNTQGQGDDFGMYAGARVQSMALLDRFTAWISVDYLPADMRRQLLGTAVPHLEPKMADKVAQYVTEHIEAFKGAKVVKPISPRGMISLGKAIANFQALLPASDKKKAVEIAINRTILNACTQQDRVVLKGIVARVFA
jgi:cobaltochelatase CobS